MEDSRFMPFPLGKNILGQSNQHEVETSDKQVVQVIHFGSNEPKAWPSD